MKILRKIDDKLETVILSVLVAAIVLVMQIGRAHV